MRNALTQRITRSRPRGWIAPVVAVMALGVALPASVVLGRVEPLSAQPAAAAMSPDTVAIVTGGGTVIVTEGTMNGVASFGLNARRPESRLRATHCAPGTSRCGKPSPAAARAYRRPLVRRCVCHEAERRK